LGIVERSKEVCGGLQGRIRVSPDITPLLRARCPNEPGWEENLGSVPRVGNCLACTGLCSGGREHTLLGWPRHTIMSAYLYTNDLKSLYLFPIILSHIIPLIHRARCSWRSERSCESRPGRVCPSSPPCLRSRPPFLFELRSPLCCFSTFFPSSFIFSLPTTYPSNSPPAAIVSVTIFAI